MPTSADACTFIDTLIDTWTAELRATPADELAVSFASKMATLMLDPTEADVAAATVLARVYRDLRPVRLP